MYFPTISNSKFTANPTRTSESVVFSRVRNNRDRELVTLVDATVKLPVHGDRPNRNDVTGKLGRIRNPDYPTHLSFFNTDYLSTQSTCP
jgi:hypothetical protein